MLTTDTVIFFNSSVWLATWDRVSPCSCLSSGESSWVTWLGDSNLNCGYLGASRAAGGREASFSGNRGNFSAVPEKKQNRGAGGYVGVSVCLRTTGILISSSAFSKTSLNIWKFTVHILWEPGLENFEHFFASM